MNPVQEQTPHRGTSRLRRAALTLAFAAGALVAHPLAAKDIGILVDRSMSVDQSNRDEAVKLIQGLMTGSVDPAVRGKWRLIEDASTEDDPAQRELRRQEFGNLSALIAGEPGNGLATGEFRLFLGEFGNLETVRKLQTVEWRAMQGDVGAEIARWAAAASPTDAETHFQLARATAAARIGAAREFYFFVVSDGVEDLVNWPVSDYLDAAKLRDPSALERGDFRDSAKARTLEMMNLKRAGGEDLVIRGGKRPGYNTAERGTLSAFERNFAERLLGRFTLTGPELRNFFQAHPGKVPVNVYVYSARPRSPLAVRFTTPADSSPQAPHPVSLSSSAIRWQLDVPAGDNPGDYHLDLTVHEPATNSEIARKPVSGDGGQLFDIFPDLANGDYELRLAAAKTGGQPARSSAFITVKRSAPVLAFLDDFAPATGRSVARRFDPRRDGDILGHGISWQWTADSPELGAPSRLERVLAFFEGSESDARPRLETRSSLPPASTSLPLGQLLTGGHDEDSSTDPLPLGGTYRLTLNATWPDGSRATASAWFILPEPNLAILGKSTAREGPDSPREVSKNESIRIGNWMHRWKNFGYDLAVFRREGNDWTLLDGGSHDWPLKLDTMGSGGAVVRVDKPFAGVLRYEVTFGPENENARELIDCPLAAGYVKSSGMPFLPWILGALAVLTLSFFGWNLFRKK